MIQNSNIAPRKKKKGEQQFLKNTSIVIVMQIISTAFYNPKRNKICQIFIPGDSRMFDKFFKMLKKYMIVAGKVFVANHKGESKKLLNSPWLHRYLQYQVSIQDVYDYVVGDAGGKDEEELLEDLVWRARRYVVDCGACASADENGEGGRENPLGFAVDERRLLWDFYEMILNAVRDTMSDVTPTVKSDRVDLIKEKMERNLTKEGRGDDDAPCSDGVDEEVREMLIHNLRNEKLENDEMWWHIRCCIDHEIWDCKDMMVNVARNNQWKAWVRQAAVEYVCRTVDVGEACERLLSGLYGKLFYWTVAQFVDSRDKRLKEAIYDYAKRYNGQEMLCDTCLVKMQDREGLERIRRYLERMRHVPKTVENPDLIQVIGEIKDVELLDELEKLLDLRMKDNFRDREYNGLGVSLVSAFMGVASNGRQEREQVFDLLERKRIFYQNQYEERLRVLEQIRMAREEWVKEQLAERELREDRRLGQGIGVQNSTEQEFMGKESAGKKSPGQKSLGQKSPEKSPEQKFLEQKSPEESSSEERSPEESSLEERSPEESSLEERSPGERFPEQSSPEERSPQQSSSEQRSPKQKSPEQASMERRSVEKKSGDKQIQERKKAISSVREREAMEAVEKADKKRKWLKQLIEDMKWRESISRFYL